MTGNLGQQANLSLIKTQPVHLNPKKIQAKITGAIAQPEPKQPPSGGGGLKIMPGNLILAPPPQAPLYKQRSWSPDSDRDEAWLKRKGNNYKRRTKSLTDEDVEELKACIELGFSFDSPDLDNKLSDTLPALGFYYAVNKQYNDTMSKSSSSSTNSESDPFSPVGSPLTIFTPGDNPQRVKTRLRHWARVVACTVRK